MILQDLHPLLLHGVLPGGVSGAVLFNSVRTSRSFKFLGQQKAIKGGSGMACCSLSERCRIGRGFLHSLLSLLKIGWYVITRGIHLVLGLCGWGCRHSICDVREAFSSCVSTKGSV